MMLCNQAKRSLFQAQTLLGFKSLVAPVQTASFSKSNWAFPKHKELLTEDFYDDDGHEPNPYARQEQYGDFEDYHKPTHRSTPSGVLSSYKKQLNLTAQDVIQKDYWDNMKDLRMDVAKQFESADRSRFTKTMVERLRLQRGSSSPIEAAGDEYGNYKKFEDGRNKVEEKNDPGYDDPGFDMTRRNVKKMFETMNGPWEEEVQKQRSENQDDIVNSTVKNEMVSDNRLMDAFNQTNSMNDHADVYSQFEMEQEALNDPEEAEWTHFGRMSPAAKEELYRSYLQGTKVKDLSLKYGILPQRVKAIIYQKHLYWEEVYPRLGETHMRMATEWEMLYAREFPFVDYGIDLPIMAEMEKGVRITKLSMVPTDTDKVTGPQRVPKTIKEDTERYLSNMRPRRHDFIPLGFIGKARAGFMLYDWVIHRGRGAPKLSDKAQKLIRYHGGEQEKRMSKELNKRMKLGGPRYAMMAQSTRRKGRSNV